MRGHFDSDRRPSLRPCKAGTLVILPPEWRVREQNNCASAMVAAKGSHSFTPRGVISAVNSVCFTVVYRVPHSSVSQRYPTKRRDTACNPKARRKSYPQGGKRRGSTEQSASKTSKIHGFKVQRSYQRQHIRRECAKASPRESWGSPTKKRKPGGNGESINLSLEDAAVQRLHGFTLAHLYIPGIERFPFRQGPHLLHRSLLFSPDTARWW